VRQTANPYSIDSVLRIVHTLALAPQGGFLMHAASAVRNGRAYLFAGASGAGKTTLARLAPPDVDLLSDEISYVRREGDGYVAYGTPFAGELGRPGENVRAPLETIYLLRHGARNHAEPVSGGEAIRSVLANILFFAEDPELVRAVFDAAFALVDRVPVFRLTFRPDREAWDLIGHTPETRQ
jgi:ATPase subunit of ABC transporter with duplicated ATPase domains